MKLDDKVILVTGACGLIAEKLVESLNKKTQIGIADSDEKNSLL